MTRPHTARTRTDEQRRTTAARMLGSKPRLLAIQHVLQNPGATKRDIVAATGLTFAVLDNVMVDLRAAGYVTAVPEGRVPGVAQKFFGDRDRVARDLAALTEWVLSGNGGTQSDGSS